MSLLKDEFNEAVIASIAAQIKGVHPLFKSAEFISEVSAQLPSFELQDRAKWTAEVLRKYLPEDYEIAVDLLIQSLGPELDSPYGKGMSVFHYAPHSYFVTLYGESYFNASMKALYAITKRYTSEFGVRPFIRKYPNECLVLFEKWVDDPDEKVRRLVSEGLRPRLPWSQRLTVFDTDYTPVLNLLEKLKDDPSLYVRKSVANHFNDLSKQDPALVIETFRAWLASPSSRRIWVVKQGLRTLLKEGNKAALALLGCDSSDGFHLEAVSLSTRQLTIGDSLRMDFGLRNESASAREFALYANVYFIKKNGKASPKTFIIKNQSLSAGEAVQLSKTIDFKNLSTRKQYPGVHRIEFFLNGDLVEVKEVEVA